MRYRRGLAKGYAPEERPAASMRAEATKTGVGERQTWDMRGEIGSGRGRNREGYGVDQQKRQAWKGTSRRPVRLAKQELGQKTANQNFAQLR